MDARMGMGMVMVMVLMLMLMIRWQTLISELSMQIIFNTPECDINQRTSLPLQ